MTKEEATELDDIMRGAEPHSYRITFDMDHWERRGLKLKHLGYIEDETIHDQKYYASLSNKGKEFLDSGGFTKKVEDDRFEKRIKKRTLWAAIVANVIALLALFVAFAAYFKK